MSPIKVLGASGSKFTNHATTTFLISDSITIDAGNIINPLGKKALNIEHIFLTHTHSDHIVDLPFLLDGFYEERTKPLKIYGSKSTIFNLKSHLFNNKIWPNFEEISLINQNVPSIKFIEINENEIIKIDDITITPFYSMHCEGSFGFVVNKENYNSTVISGDSYINENLTNILNDNKTIENLIIDCSFPSNLEELGKISNHLTPESLIKQLKDIKNKNLKVFIYHTKHSNKEDIRKEVENLNLFNSKIKILDDNDIIKSNKIPK